MSNGPSTSTINSMADVWEAYRAELDGVDVIEQDLWSDALAEYSTDGKIGLAKELERLTLAVDPRIRVDDANYADAASESAVATTTGIRRTGRENGCYVVVSTLADDADEAAIAQNRNAARNIQNLGEAVADEHDRDAIG